MTWSAEKAAQDVWDDLDKGGFREGVRALLARHLQSAYEAGWRDSDQTSEQAAFDGFIASLKPGDPDEGLPTIDDVRGILKTDGSET